MKINYSELEKDIASIENLSLEEVKKLENKYSKAIKEINKPKESKPAKNTKSSTSDKKFKYPFLMYFGHEYRNVSHIFEEGKKYTEAEITLALANHGYKEFKIAPQVEYEYFEDENCLFPKFKVGNRG